MNRRIRTLQIATEDVLKNSDGVPSLGGDKDNDVMQGRFRGELLETTQGSGFSVSLSRAQKTREHYRGPRISAQDWHIG